MCTSSIATTQRFATRKRKTKNCNHLEIRLDYWCIWMWNRRNAIDVLQLCATPNPNKNSTLRISQILTNNILNLWWVGFAHPSTRFFVVARSINSEKEKNKVDFDLGPIPSVVVLRWDHFGTTQEVVDAILSQSWLFCWNFFLIFWLLVLRTCNILPKTTTNWLIQTKLTPTTKSSNGTSFF